MSKAIRPKDLDDIYLDPGQYLQVRRRYNYYGPFTVMNLSLLTYSNEATAGCASTLNTLIAIVAHRNEAQATHEKLAEFSGKSLPTIARHMRQLRESRILINNTAVPYASYLFHPLYLWKGTAKQRDEYWASLPPDHPFKKLLEELNTEYETDKENEE